MIDVKLETKDYCENCNQFQPESELLKTLDDDGTKTNTVIVSCKYKKYCACLSKHFENLSRK